MLQPDLPQVDRTYEREARGPHGTIPLRVYRGAGTADMGDLPVHVYYHGGGWVLGDLDSHDWVCRKIANGAQCAVVSVDYRMAPEFPFPVPYDDALAALKWVAAKAGALKVDASKISVGGDSAGGNLAAALAIAARDGDAPKLKSQILVYPVTDCSMSGNYYGRFTEGLLLTDETMQWFIDLYVPDKAQRKDWRASPLLAKSLEGVAPAFVLTAGFDPLCAEGEAYAARLKAEGVAVSTASFPGQIHGFLSNGKLLPKANDAVEQIVAALKAAFR
jgi:acetyl esterase